jgi:hypothetical protein
MISPHRHPNSPYFCAGHGSSINDPSIPVPLHTFTKLSTPSTLASKFIIDWRTDTKKRTTKKQLAYHADEEKMVLSCVIFRNSSHAVPAEEISMPYPVPLMNGMNGTLAFIPQTLVYEQQCGGGTLYSDVPSAPLRKRRKFSHKKNVRFEESENEIFYLQYDHDEQDLKKSWIQQDEYQGIRNENRDTLLELKRVRGRVSQLNVDDFCIRGLEEQISIYLLRGERHRQRKFARRIVQFQNEQRRLGYTDASALSAMCAVLAQPALRKATNLANMDAASKINVL